MTQKATVNWNLSSMLLQYLGSYYPLGLRSLSPVLKMALIGEDVSCGGKKIQFCYENCSLILSVCLYIEYSIFWGLFTFGVKCCTANHWARFDIMLFYYLFVLLMDSCVHSLMSHICSDGTTARSNWLILSHTHSWRVCQRGNWDECLLVKAACPL